MMITHHSIAKIRSALKWLDPSDRTLWVNMAFAIKSELGDLGRDVWEEWGQGHQRPASEVIATWKSAKARGKLKIGTLFYEAKRAGWVDDKKFVAPSSEEIKRRRADVAARQAEEAAEEARVAADAAQRALKMWESAVPAEAHIYLAKKGVKSHELRVGTREYLDAETGEVCRVHGCLFIPMRDRRKKLHSLQMIDPDGERKLYLRGGAKRGHFFHIGQEPQLLDGKPVFVLAEGYATAASVHEATRHMVLVCFDSSNLEPVARVLRERRPDAVIVFAADNDLWNRKPDGTPTNPGVIAASAAAKAVGGTLVLPPFNENHTTGTNDKGHAVGPTDWNDWHAMHGLEAVEKEFAAMIKLCLVPAPSPEHFPTLSPDQCKPYEMTTATRIDSSQYFQILGYDGDDYWIYHVAKQQAVKRNRAHFSGNTGLVELAPISWWEENFPGARGCCRTAAFEWFTTIADFRGVFDPRTRMRGRGAWIDNARFIFHHGDHLSAGGRSVRLDFPDSRFIYNRASRLVPLTTQLAASEGKKLVRIAQQMRWANPASAYFLSGWIFLATIGGALKWRPHLWISGESGSGKSTILNRFVGTLLGPVRVSFDGGDSSAAGVRQSLASDALPVVIDEAEAKDERGKERIRGLLTLARGASTDSEAVIAKGTVAGRALDFQVRSMFCFGAIGALAVDQQSDNSRFATLFLRNLEGNESQDTWHELRAELESLRTATALPAAIASRAILMFDVLSECIQVFSSAVSDRLKHSRHGDQYGTLLAGCWCLENDVVVSESEARDLVSGIVWDDFCETQPSGARDADRCLDAIVHHRFSEKGTTVSIISLIAKAAGLPVDGLDVSSQVATRLLHDRGITITVLRGVRYLSIIRNNPVMPEILRGTAFEHDWQSQLPRVTGYLSIRATTYGERQDRGHAYPLSNILDRYALT